MPAISPSKLKIQSSRLAENFYQPGVFIQEMHTLLEFYADNTHRPGKSMIASALLHSYNVPPPVLQEIFKAVEPLALSDSENTVLLCDQLWNESCLEHRKIACKLLGLVSVELVDTTHQRLETWAQTINNEQFLDYMAFHCWARVRKVSPNLLIQFSDQWLKSSDLNLQRLALQTLIHLVEDASFQNLPAVFYLLAPYFRSTPPNIRPSLVKLLQSLAQKSPIETATLLKSVLEQSQNSNAAWLTRQAMRHFPHDIQNLLRQTLRKT